MDEEKLEERALREISGGSNAALSKTVDVLEWPKYYMIGRFEVGGDWAVMTLKYLISKKINLNVNQFRLFNRDHTEELTYNSPISRVSDYSHIAILLDKSPEI